MLRGTLAFACGLCSLFDPELSFPQRRFHAEGLCHNAKGEHRMPVDTPTILAFPHERGLSMLERSMGSLVHQRTTLRIRATSGNMAKVFVCPVQHASVGSVDSPERATEQRCQKDDDCGKDKHTLPADALW